VRARISPSSLAYFQDVSFRPPQLQRRSLEERTREIGIRQVGASIGSDLAQPISDAARFEYGSGSTYSRRRSPPMA
jgi:hypothetical protein